MNPWVQMVKAFHEKFGQPVATEPTLLGRDRAMLRTSLITEEANETDDAISESVRPTLSDAEVFYGSDEPMNLLARIADGLADTIYVVIGTALEYGIDIDKVFREIHRSNMTKDIGPNRPDGKITKGPTFEPPRIREIIEADMVRGKVGE